MLYLSRPSLIHESIPHPDVFKPCTRFYVQQSGSNPTLAPNIENWQKKNKFRIKHSPITEKGALPAHSPAPFSAASLMVQWPSPSDWWRTIGAPNSSCFASMRVGTRHRGRMGVTPEFRSWSRKSSAFACYTTVFRNQYLPSAYFRTAARYHSSHKYLKIQNTEVSSWNQHFLPKRALTTERDQVWQDVQLHILQSLRRESYQAFQAHWTLESAHGQTVHTLKKHVWRVLVWSPTPQSMHL